MDLEKIAEKLRDMIIGEIKEELRDFKASVTGELAGFRIAIESMNARMSALELRQENLEAEIRDIRRALEETNKRIDETNKRIDDLLIEVSHIRGDLNRALSEKEVIDDILIRVQRLEVKVLEAA
ncbi:MAG: hypothetical protein ACK4K4_06190 [Caldimicrobium sp.]